MNAPADERPRPNPFGIGSLAGVYSIFLGLSVLLGRVYLILYTQKLGIPVSSINIGAIDHAIVSPDIAIISVSIAISIPLLLVLGPNINLLFYRLNKWLNPFVIGVVLLGLLMIFIPAKVLTGPDLLPVGIRGAVTSSGVILVSLGLMTLTSLFPARFTGTGANIARYVGYAIVLGTLVGFLSWSIVTFASDDAFKDVMESPTAELDVFGTGDSPVEIVNIVYINDNFTFVVNFDEVDSLKDKGFDSLNEARSPHCNGAKGALQIRAIPNESILRIKYINNRETVTATTSGIPWLNRILRIVGCHPSD